MKVGPIPTLKIEKIYKEINLLLNTYSPNYPELSLRLYLQSVQAIGNLSQVSEPESLEDLAYEFASQALVIYQDELSDSESKF